MHFFKEQQKIIKTITIYFNSASLQNILKCVKKQSCKYALFK